MTQTKPIIQGVRVLFPGGRMIHKLTKGEPGELLYCSGSLDNWSPTRSRPTVGGDDRMHQLTDAIFIPGFATSTRARPADGEVIMNWTKVSLGDTGLAGARSPVVRKLDLQSLHSSLVVALATLNLSPVANAQAIAALGPVVSGLNSILGTISTNVQAT